ncbi:colorectal mutant cancer protein-like, partial [Sinocyclocheilus grahami]|uniref:colorectal mutant cancer protein-like n=1 Tax=Sinocyclocheilus grahami TaxID=75366 RepID=UPI0007ACEC76
VAERVKLSKTRSESLPAERSVLGSEISSIGVSSNVAEHLAHSLQDCSNIQEIFQTLYSHGSAISESKIREFEVETERLNSRIEHLKSQNDLLTITLEECKTNAERMSMLVGKYESNATALRLALQYRYTHTNHLNTLTFCSREQAGEESITQILKKAHDSRKTAEIAAKDLLTRLDGSCGAAFAVSGCSVQPWESLSSNSHTSTTSSTASSCDTDFSKDDEQRLKDYMQQLKNDRAAVKLTMLELESVHIDPLSCDVKPRGDSQRLDLENAVLMQELMAMKREKKLKGRVQELVAALERLTKSSEVRHQQSAEFVNDLKRANSNLVAAYEKAKKKHQNKLKKLESQMMAMVERHETQVRMLKQRIALLEEETSRPHTSETSL